MPGLPHNAFVVKDRVESIEKKLEQVLNEEGLHELAKDITKKAIASSLTSSKQELAEIVSSAKEAAAVDKLIIIKDFTEQLQDHLIEVEMRVVKSEKIAKLAVAASIVLLICNLLSFIF
jgi:uncharacterized protein YyaL (SSP411 family)